MKKDEKAKKKALKKASRSKIVKVERALTRGDLDGRRERAKRALEAPPLAADRLKGGSIAPSKADEETDE